MKNIAIVIISLLAVGCSTITKKSAIVPPVPPTKNPLVTILPATPPTPPKFVTRSFGNGNGHGVEVKDNGWVGDPVTYTNITNPRFFTNEFGILFVVSALQRSNNVLTVHAVSDEYPDFIAAEFSCWPANQSWYIATEYEEGEGHYGYVYGVNTPCVPEAQARVARQLKALGDKSNKTDLVGIRKAAKVYTGRTLEEILVKHKQEHSKRK